MIVEVDLFICHSGRWQAKLKKLRAMLLEFPLTEEIKWNKPCYSFEGRNVVVLLPLKNFLAALFCKGSLLNNDHGFLVQAGENSQAQRQFRFSNPGQLRERATAFTALGRHGKSEEVRALVAFVESGVVLYHPGTKLTVKGGTNAQKQVLAVHPCTDSNHKPYDEAVRFELTFPCPGVRTGVPRPDVKQVFATLLWREITAVLHEKSFTG